MEDLIVDNYDHIDSSVFYTSTNIPGKGYDENLFHSRLLIKCSCTTECQDQRSCACIQNQKRNYDNGKLVDSKLLSESPVLECNSNCQCSLTCGNRLVQFGPLTGLKIIEFPGKGYGIITTHRVLRGQFICEYAGELISIEEAIARRNFDKNHNYIFSLNEFVNNKVTRTIIDATRIGNIGRYINHSCEPNCKIIPVRIDSVVPKLAIFASQDIDTGAEITYRYGDTNVASTSKNIELKYCLCESVSCKKFLPHEV